jgi:hypothetical protein
MGAYHRTFADLGAFLGRIGQPDLFGGVPDSELEAVRHRFHCRRARQRRREAMAPYLRRPWLAWAATGDAARIVRRFLVRHPEHDRPDPGDDLLTDRQAAARYHIEEAENEARYGREGEW